MPDSIFEFDCHGVMVKISPAKPDDHITNKCKGGHFYEQPMLEDMQSRLNPGDRVLDIGAHVGGHTVFMAKVAGLQVDSFEPCDLMYGKLVENIQLNGIGDLVTPHHMAVGARAGKGHSEMLSETNLGFTKFRVGDGDVPVNSIDNMCFSDITAMKIDVEGMEMPVLCGAAEMLRTQKPIVYVEAGVYQSFETIRDYLAIFGYEKVDVFNGTPTYLFIAS